MNHESDSLACGSVGLGEEGVHLDTADTVTLDHAELDVSLVSPGGSPRVLDEPVVATVLGTVADGEDGVIEVGSASDVVHDTSLVELEAGHVGLDGNSGGLEGKSGLHLVHVGWGDVGVARDGDSGGGGSVVLA